MQIKNIKRILKEYINLKAHEKIRAVFVGESILCEGVSCFLDGGELLRGPEERVELPSLPSDVIIGRPQPWTVSVADLQLPHYLVALHKNKKEELERIWNLELKL